MLVLPAVNTVAQSVAPGGWLVGTQKVAGRLEVRSTLSLVTKVMTADAVPSSSCQPRWLLGVSTSNSPPSSSSYAGKMSATALAGRSLWVWTATGLP